MTADNLKYEPLEQYLGGQPATTSAVTLSFEQIEKIIGATLPASAYEHQAWWGNQQDFSTRPQAKAWLSAGFVVDFVRPIRGLGQVRFKRK